MSKWKCIKWVFATYDATKRCTCKLPRTSRDLKSVEKFWSPIWIETFGVSFLIYYENNISDLGNLPNMTN